MLSRDAPYNETGWKDPAADKLLFEAIGTVDEAAGARRSGARCSACSSTRAGYLVYANQTYVDGLAKEVNGLEPSKAAWLSGFELHNAWLASER